LFSFLILIVEDLKGHINLDLLGDLGALLAFL
jgi:hypothetical protein